MLANTRDAEPLPMHQRKLEEEFLFRVSLVFAVLKQGILKRVNISIKLPAGLYTTIKLSCKLRIRVVFSNNITVK